MSAATATDASVSPWRNRNFQIVWTGGLLNDVGDWLLLVALPVYVFSETGSGGSTALLFLVQYGVAIVFGPYAGTLVDRFDLRRTLIMTNVAQAVALLPLLAVTPDRIWPALVVAALQSVLTRLNNPAKVALLPRLVAADQIVAANAANSTGSSMARLIGSPLGGIVVEFGGLGAVVVADGISFLAVALATYFVCVPAAPDAAAVSPALEADVGEPGPGNGLRPVWMLLRADRVLRRVVVTLAVSQIAQGMFVVVYLAFIVRKLDGDPADIGLIRGSQAVGGVLGGIVIARLAGRLTSSSLFVGGMLGLGVMSYVIWNGPQLTTALGVYLALFAVVGLPVSALDIGSGSLAQQLCPPMMLGRVVGIAETASLAGAAIGSAGAGLLLDRVALDLLLNVEASIWFGLGCYAAFGILGRRAARDDAGLRGPAGDGPSAGR